MTCILPKKKAVASCSTCLTALASDFASAMPVRSYLLTSQKLAQRKKFAS